MILRRCHSAIFLITMRRQYRAQRIEFTEEVFEAIEISDPAAIRGNGNYGVFAAAN
jgi:hypothetical protein